MPTKSLKLELIEYIRLNLGDKFIIMDATAIGETHHTGEDPFICVRTNDVKEGWHTLFSIPDPPRGMLSNWTLPENALVMRVR